MRTRVDLTLADRTAANSALLRAERWLAKAAQVVAFVCVCGMLAAAGITMIDVLLRWLVNMSVPALNEIIEMLFAVAISACIPAGLARGVNLKIDILTRWINPRLHP